MWPDSASVVYYVGIGVHALIAALLGQRFGLRARVPVAISVCYLAGMTIGAKTLSDIGEGRFEPGALLRREHFVAGGYWGGPAVYLLLAVPAVLVMTKSRVQRSALSGQRSGGTKGGTCESVKGERGSGRSAAWFGLLARSGSLLGRLHPSRVQGSGEGAGTRSQTAQAGETPTPQVISRKPDKAGETPAPPGHEPQAAQGGRGAHPPGHEPQAASPKPQSSRSNPYADPPASQWRAGLDLIALAAPIPMIVAKVACLCAGCCHGKAADLAWAITFPPGGRIAPGGVPLHPTQVYDMLALVVAAGVLAGVNRPYWRGTLLFWFVGLYGLGRLVTEFTRGDLGQRGVQWWGPLTAFQWLCAAAVAACAAALVVYGRRSAVSASPKVVSSDQTPSTPAA